jgi:hypothetical protein
MLRKHYPAPDEKRLVSRFWQSASGSWRGLTASRARLERQVHRLVEGAVAPLLDVPVLLLFGGLSFLLTGKDQLIT